MKFAKNNVKRTQFGIMILVTTILYLYQFELINLN